MPTKQPKQPTAHRRHSGPSQHSASPSRSSHSAARLDERLAALERLVSEQAAQLARQHEVIAAQDRRLAALDAGPAASTTPAPAGAPGNTAPGRRSRRAVLRLGGMAAAASAAALAGAGATELARPGVAHAAGVAWATGTVSADELTHVVPNNTFGSKTTDTAVLDVTVTATSTATPAHPLTLVNSAAIAAYDTTVAGQVALYADSINGSGLVAHGDNRIGVNGLSKAGTGVSGQSSTGFGVEGSAPSGVGAHFMGGTAPLLLDPASVPGAPTSGTHTKGEIYLDSGATVWVCTASGMPGKWAKPGVNLLPAPIRIFDSRSGQPAPLPTSKTPLPGNTTTTIQVTGTTVNSLSVPAGVSGVVGNVTVTNAQNFGDLILFPHGAPQPLTSNINYGPGQNIANFATVGLSADGKMDVFVHVSTTDVIFDVAGYVL